MAESSDPPQRSTDLILEKCYMTNDSDIAQCHLDSPSPLESMDSSEGKDQQKSSVEEQFEALGEGLEAASKAYRALLTQCSSFNKQYSEILTERDQLKDQLGSLILEYELLQKAKKESEEELDKMKDDIAELRILREETNRLRSLQTEIERVRMECNEKKAKYEAVLAANERLSADLEELRKAYSIAKQYIDRAKSVEEENRRLRMEIESSLHSREAESLRQELKQLQETRTDLEKSLIDSRKKIEELQRQNQEVMTMDQAVKKHLEDMEKENQKAKEEIRQIRKELEDSSSERQRLSQFKIDYYELMERYERLKAEHESLKKKFEMMPRIVI